MQSHSIRILLFWLAIAISLTGCVATDYLGDSYPATDRVDIFYSKDAVTRPHKEMGRVTAIGLNADKIKEELVDEAKAHGAHAVVIEDMDRILSNANTIGISTEGAATTMPTNDQIRVSALFLRYR